MWREFLDWLKSQSRLNSLSLTVPCCCHKNERPDPPKPNVYLKLGKGDERVMIVTPYSIDALPEGTPGNVASRKVNWSVNDGPTVSSNSHGLGKETGEISTPNAGDTVRVWITYLDQRGNESLPNQVQVFVAEDETAPPAPSEQLTIGKGDFRPDPVTP